MSSVLFCISLSLGSCSLPSACGAERSSGRADRPNIVLIYADDIGYGDLSCYGATRVSTPNLDGLAKQGMRFTDAHSPSATCTPSRYAMLTGQYAWRKSGTGIARGDAALIIDPQQPTLASLLADAGYQTAVVGKWHLGLGDGHLDWNREIKPGPLELGFDTCFLIPATGDRVPCVYVKDHHVVDLDPQDPIRVSFQGPIGDDPTGKDHAELLTVIPSHGHDQTIINGISRIGYMEGGHSARWRDEEMADRITEEAVGFIESSPADQPIFLFFSTHDIHVPRVPHPRFVGKTEMGPRGDAIVQLDWCVGQIVDALEKTQRLENTLLIFTSDNGPVVDDGYQDQAVKRLGGHQPAGPWRGGKYSNFEGGTRVPLIVHWPQHVKPGVSNALVSQVDFFASFAALIDNEIEPGAAPDSLDTLSAFLGQSETGRSELVEHARALSLRSGSWKLIERSPGAKLNRSTNTELGNDAQPQLYNLDNDPGETTNVADQHPEVLKQLLERLEEIKQQ